MGGGRRTQQERLSELVMIEDEERGLDRLTSVVSRAILSCSGAIGGQISTDMAALFSDQASITQLVWRYVLFFCLQKGRVGLKTAWWME